MAIDYSITAKALVKELGGNENIRNVTHCATRLRFILKDAKNINTDTVRKIPGVITTVEAGGQYQVVIGNHVQDAYKEVIKLVTIEEGNSEPAQKVGVVSRIIDVISSIFAPFLYTLAACGILQGILGVLVAMNVMDTSWGTYKILNFISWTAFTFLPVLIAVTASKKFKVNEFIGIVIACALVSPDYIAMVNAGESLTFLGIKVQMLSYTSTVIPIILAIWIASYVQRFFDKKLPIVIRNLFTPMFTIAIMVPLTLLVCGPLGNMVGGAIGDVYNSLYDLSPIVAGVVVGGLWEVMVIFGVHWGITPVTVGNYASLGYDTFTGIQGSAVFSQAGAALGVFFRTKDKELKQVSLPAAITGLFGITEPAIYGVNLRLKTPMICGCIAGAVGGGIAGAFHAYSWSYNMPGIATLPAYFKEGYMSNFLGYVISIIISFVLAMVLTMIVGFKEDKEEVKTSQPAEVSVTTKKMRISSPLSGKVIALTDVSDDAFSSEAMGKGAAIIPNEGKVYAPFDGTVAALFPTGHAIGLMSDSGEELLIHIGIDTVGMGGKGFEVHVTQNDRVKKGQLLITFSLEEIQKAGFETTTMVIVSNTEEFKSVESLAVSNVVQGQELLEIQK
ncbi:MAG TPA: PTS beta-glucoside transporter subunit EIIBCA [Lachnospiraceae bacterium]|uniref:beta-glucoside-specific PTS transporter subunit IIABC n=1 Tax=Anaerosporobacter sp. TaxID=1872529 RepID=UPI000EE24586|nr:beta-glucoside-specific PTS transporter subunit IIABC [Anaerosporobacter sp.]HAB59658.1 PTS beta-glucoside transporter subunit EIIBCA [Lachnospiraceae bacterium]